MPFSGVDSVMHALDEPRRPQTIELEVAVSDRLDERRLRHAVVEAAARHPMARARQVPAKPFDPNYAWEIDRALTDDPVDVRAVEQSPALDAARDTFFSRHIDLNVGPPFRVLHVHEGDAGDRVMLSVNHSAFDGVGALRLLQSMSRAYAGEADPLPDVDVMEARKLPDKRGRRGGPRPLERPGVGLGERPARLASSPSPSGRGFGILHLDLSASEAVSPGPATVNDVLMAALHLTVEEWNRSRGAPCDRVTVMMPVNQRPAAWRGEVVANLVLPGRVASTPADRARRSAVLAKVAAQTGHIKTQGVGGTPNPIPGRAPVVLRRLLPHLIDAAAAQMADTAVLSNLGRVEDPPWFAASGRGLWFGPPPRSPVILTIGAATAEGRLAISLRWCNDAFSTPAARQFADALVASIHALAEGSD